MRVSTDMAHGVVYVPLPGMERFAVPVFGQRPGVGDRPVVAAEPKANKCQVVEIPGQLSFPFSACLVGGE